MSGVHILPPMPDFSFLTFVFTTVLPRRHEMTRHPLPQILARITLCLFAVTLFAVTLCGCGDLIPPRPPIALESDSPASAPLGDNTEIEDGSQLREVGKVDEPFEGDWGDWYVHRYQDQVVGISRVSAESSLNLDQLESGPTEVTYKRTQQVVFQSGAVSFVRSLTEVSHEAPQGELRNFNSQWTTGPVAGEINGVAQNRSLVIKATGENAFETRVDRPQGLRSMFALEQTLRRRPIATGEVRRLPVVSPNLRSINVLLIRCEGESSVQWLDGTTRQLKEVKAEWNQEGQLVDEAVVWVSESGEIEKQFRAGMRLETFRTDRRTAEQLFGRRRTDLVEVQVQTDLRAPKKPKEILFLISRRKDSQLDEQASESVPPVPAIGTQSIRRLGQQVSVLVGNENGPQGNFDNDDSVAGPDDLASTLLVDHGSQIVRQLSNRVQELPQDALAIELAKQVNQRLSLMPQGTLRKASEILRTGRGGEVDHAIVLTSVLRSRQIPSRIVFGLVLDQDDGDEIAESETTSATMTLGAWVLASVEDRWIPIDPVRSEVSGADRIGLLVVSGETEMEQAYQKVFRLVSQLHIEIVDAK